MYKHLFCTIALFGLCLISMAQVIYSPMNKDDFDEAPFQFKGKRVMMGDRVDNSHSKNIYLFTKNEQGIDADKLYAQQFEKIGEVWFLKKDTTITSSQTVILWENRKGFFNSETDTNLVSYFAYCEGDPHNNITDVVSLLVFHNGHIYFLTEYKNHTTIKSDNFENLPTDIKAKLLEYWNKLDKWK